MASKRIAIATLAGVVVLGGGATAAVGVAAPPTQPAPGPATLSQPDSGAPNKAKGPAGVTGQDKTSGETAAAGNKDDGQVGEVGQVGESGTAGNKDDGQVGESGAAGNRDDGQVGQNGEQAAAGEQGTVGDHNDGEAGNAGGNGATSTPPATGATPSTSPTAGTNSNG